MMTKMVSPKKCPRPRPTTRAKVRTRQAVRKLSTFAFALSLLFKKKKKNISRIAKGFQNVWQNLEVLDVAVDFASFYHMETFVQLLAVTNILIIS